MILEQETKKLSFAIAVCMHEGNIYSEYDAGIPGDTQTRRQRYTHAQDCLLFLLAYAALTYCLLQLNAYNKRVSGLLTTLLIQ